jgi:hypothetical protein
MRARDNSGATAGHRPHSNRLGRKEVAERVPPKEFCRTVNFAIRASRLRRGSGKMEQNVADLIGKKFVALAVQCEIPLHLYEPDVLRCDITTNPTPEYFDVKGSIEVDELVGRNVTQMAYSQFTKMAVIYPVGGPKTCMARLGSGRGLVELVCSENEDDLVHFIKEPEVPSSIVSDFRDALRARNLKGDIP